MHLKGAAVLLVYTHIRTCIVDIIVSIIIHRCVHSWLCILSLGVKGDCCGVGEHRRMCVVVGCVDPLLITV